MQQQLSMQELVTPLTLGVEMEQVQQEPQMEPQREPTQ